jgi:hypothetical protein
MLLAGIVSTTKSYADDNTSPGARVKGFCAPINSVCGVTANGTTLVGIWTEV